jgi:hypothetical protein
LESTIATPQPLGEVLAVDEKLHRLATTDPVAANLVKLRLFVGSNMTKSVAAVGIAVRSATDAWA